MLITIPHDGPFDFTSMPFGQAFTWRGQRYEFQGLEPYTRKDGSESALAVMLSKCPVCGTWFELRASLGAKSLNRRCSTCAMPRVAVNPGRRKPRKPF